MSSLTERYIGVAARNVPEAQRSEFGQELRERIGDAIDARIGSGSNQADAERDAVAELGDPVQTAASYIDRPLHLIGPRFYLQWLRLLKTLAAVVIPFGMAGILLSQLISGASFGELVGATISDGLSIAVHLCFWTTLVFVIIERTGGSVPGEKWTPEQLPELPKDGRGARRADMIASLAFLALFIGAIIWQNFGVVFRDGVREPVPLLNPGLWSFWIPYFIALLVLEAVFTVAVYRTGWTRGLAVINTVMNLVFIIPALWLFLSGRLVDPAFLGVIGWPWEANAGTVITVVAVVGVVLGAGWEIVDGFRRASRERAARQVHSA